MTALAESTPGPRDPAADPRRWLTLGIVLISTIIVVLDNTVLNVAIPTILRDFHTTLPSLQWVITGYALTFATLLIIGGRLCDLYGTRRIFIIGAALFGVGSLLASVSWNVASLVVGEAIIEGIGASLMLPSALAVLSSTFSGRERGMAFAAWGAIAGSAAGLGPVLGGFLTTDFSWRWSFRINVVVAPLAILGAVLFIAATPRTGRREPLDVVGAGLSALGMFLAVFALSEGGTYGWLTPLGDFHVGGADVWPASRPVSMVPVTFALSIVALVGFSRYELWRERRQLALFFPFRLLRYPTFKYGLVTSTALSLAALGFSLAMALYLQESLRVSALENGLWMLPYGLMILASAPVGGSLTQRISTLSVVRIGLVAQAAGLVYLALSVSTHLSFARFMPGLVVYGIGCGFAFSQLTNIVLSEIPVDRSGVASGTNTTLRQVGNALGIALIGTIVTTRSIDAAVAHVRASTALTAAAKRSAIAGIHAMGANYQPGADQATLNGIIGQAVAVATHDALVFASFVVAAGIALSALIPKVGTPPASLADELGVLVPLEAEGPGLGAGGTGRGAARPGLGPAVADA